MPVASQSLYRRWRSQSFEDLIGQPHVVRTLRNAVTGGRVAHAYLFTGPRGIGKTSVARIMAKAVNCLNPVDGSPCNRCTVCVNISSGASPDIIEIDGASNTGIDDIRALRERAAFAPVEARFKVYIIDEVHRLSGNAFDGLLKTLEEPPGHVIFLFASTEPHKVPATILSRCQRFDLRKIERDDMLGRLKVVAEEEGLRVDDDAFTLIIHQSGGSLRDGLGILDQVRAFSGDTVTADDVRGSVGLAAPDSIMEVAGAMLANDLATALRAINASQSAGVDPRMLSRQLIDYWRALLLQAGGADAAAQVDPVFAETLALHAQSLKSGQVVQVLKDLTEQVVEPRLNVAPSLPLEIGVVQAILKLHESSSNDGVRERQVQRTPSQFGPPRESYRPAPDSRPPRAIADSESIPPSEQAGLESTAKPADPEEFGNLADASGSAQLETLPGDKEELFATFVAAMRERNPRVQALLRNARVLSWTDDEVILGFQHTYHFEGCETPDSKAIIREVLREVTGLPLNVRSRLDRTSTGPADDLQEFKREAEHMLRGVHARQLRDSIGGRKSAVD
jgi:DNA polymerase-3 subunit gamma/tau